MEIITNSDNVAVFGMFAAVIIFTWVALSEARRNDRLSKKGKAAEIPKRMRK